MTSRPPDDTEQTGDRVPVSTSPQPAPPTAAEAFGAGLGLAERYAAMLAKVAVPRGLIGPREVPRLWNRHLLNSAVLTDLVPPDQRVVDVGAGAGLPGIAMAIRRPDLRVDLVEPMQRRTTFLTEAVTELGLLDRVRVVRGRAEDRSVVETVGAAAYVVARAVAPLDRLGAWCIPLLARNGTLLALKGSSAAAELERHRPVLRRLGATGASITMLDSLAGVEPTYVVIVRVGPQPRGRVTG